MKSSATSSTPPHVASQPKQTFLVFFITLLIFTTVGYCSLSPRPYLYLNRQLNRLYGVLIRYSPPLPKVLAPSNDLSIAIKSFQTYHHTQIKKLNKAQRSFSSLNAEQRKWGKRLGWNEKLGMMEEFVEVNARICEGLGMIGMSEARKQGEILSLRSRWNTQEGRVVEVLKHFVRDWSDEGKSERDVLFPPILEALDKEHEQRSPKGEKPKVLVPGCGLGRLAYEIAANGFDTTANDFSHFMNLGSSLIFKSTSRPREHTVHPYLHSFSHHRSFESMTRSVKFPDIVPSRNVNLKFVGGDFLREFPHQAKFDSVVTLFFIDTAYNIAAYLETIWKVLKPGGIWINEGPCLWYGTPAMALSMDDIVKLAQLIGFEIEQRRTIKEARYTADAEGMYTFAYDCEFWVARKPITSVT